MKIIKRIGLILTAIIVLFLLGIGIFLLFVPISRSNEAVRNYVLRNIPAGTAWNDAMEIIEDKGWEVNRLNYEYGLRINDAAGNTSFATADDLNDVLEGNNKIRIVGVKSMHIELGEYYGPLHTAVSAYLAFEENDQLVEATVRRDIDAP